MNGMFSVSVFSECDITHAWPFMFTRGRRGWLGFQMHIQAHRWPEKATIYWSRLRWIGYFLHNICSESSTESSTTICLYLSRTIKRLSWSEDLLSTSSELLIRVLLCRTSNMFASYRLPIKSDGTFKVLEDKNNNYELLLEFRSAFKEVSLY